MHFLKLDLARFSMLRLSLVAVGSGFPDSASYGGWVCWFSTLL